MNKMMSYMLMSEMMNGKNGLSGDSNNMGSILPFMMLGGGNFSDMFDGMFDFDTDDDTDETTTDNTADEEAE